MAHRSILTAYTFGAAETSRNCGTFSPIDYLRPSMISVKRGIEETASSPLAPLRSSGPTHRRIPKLCQTSSGIVPRMRIPRTRFCRAPSLITICEAIPPPGISKVAQNSPNPNRLS